MESDQQNSEHHLHKRQPGIYVLCYHRQFDKGRFYYFKIVTVRTIFYAGLSTELRNSQCYPYGRLEVCFIVTKEHIEDLKLPVYCGPRTLKLENKESLFFVAANFEFIAL